MSNIRPSIYALAATLYAASDEKGALTFLHRRSVSPDDCIRFLMDEGNLSRDEATRRLHESAAWRGKVEAWCPREGEDDDEHEAPRHEVIADPFAGVAAWVPPKAAGYGAIDLAALGCFLSGDRPGLDVLRAQWWTSRVVERSANSYAIVSDIEVHADAPRLAGRGRHVLYNVWCEVEGCEAPCSAVLFIGDGALSCVEIVTAMNDLPDEPVVTEWFYFPIPRPLDLPWMADGNAR